MLCSMMVMILMLKLKVSNIVNVPNKNYTIPVCYNNNNKKKKKKKKKIYNAHIR